jgi:hypothetical protein
MSQALIVLGVLLVAVAAVIALADTDDLSRKMPVQVPPRRLALYPLVCGVVLVVVGVIGALLP